MKIFTFVFSSSDIVGENGQIVSSTKHIVAKDMFDAFAVAAEKGLSDFVQVSEGPEVFAVAGMFE